MNVLSHFGKNLTYSKKKYLTFVKKAADQGRRPELVGGGLVRSLGGWAAVKKLRSRGKDRLKGDERIPGDSDFVITILAEANEQLDRRYALKRQGYNLNALAKRVSTLFGIDETLIYEKGRRKEQVRARDLFCYWAVEELGMHHTELACGFQ